VPCLSRGPSSYRPLDWPWLLVHSLKLLQPLLLPQPLLLLQPHRVHHSRVLDRSIQTGSQVVGPTCHVRRVSHSMGGVFALAALRSAPRTFNRNPRTDGAQDKEPISWVRSCLVVGVERLFARGSTSARTSLPVLRADYRRLGRLSHDPAQLRLRLFRKELCSSGSMHVVSWYAPTQLLMLIARPCQVTDFRPSSLTYRSFRSHYVLMDEGDGQLHTLTVLEQLREASKSLWGASSEAYFRVDELLRQLANPNLHDFPAISPFGSRCGTARISTFAG
jgi:hypothetical protein